MQLLKKKDLYDSNRILHIPVDQLMTNPAQPRKRFDANNLKELTASIKQYGVIQPLTVRKIGSCYELIAGERRLRASKLAGLKTVPCIVMGCGSEDSSILALVENLQRRDLDFIEEAEGINNLICLFGISQESLAKKLGKSQSAIANKLRILKLPPEILNIIREAGLTERHARALLRVPGDKARLDVLGHVIRNGLSVLKTEEYIDSLFEPAQSHTQQRAAAGRNAQRSSFVLKDVRLFINTVTRGMDMMKHSGIDATFNRNETDNNIILTIEIPKNSKVNLKPQ